MRTQHRRGNCDSHLEAPSLKSRELLQALVWMECLAASNALAMFVQLQQTSAMLFIVSIPEKPLPKH